MNNIFDKTISLIEPGHKYVLETNPSLKFRSVTEIVGDYFEAFDKHTIANNLVSNNPKYMHLQAEDLIAKWDAARDYGTKIHKEIEDYLKEGKYPEEVKSVYAVEWLKKYQMKSDVDIFSEIKVYSTELNIAGSIDILAHDKKADTYEVIDWKTSKNIETKSFNNKMGTHPVTSNLQDCKFVHYSLQLSFYRYLLEQYYGLTINNQLIAHLKEDGCTGYVGRYYQKEVIDIIENQKNNKDQS
jgi:hypothetical protein|tara:strand:+ start:242 stop:967 length:726 start_codon:yes stop_codon:yes gene_type:complete